jgi:hypothetical protein
MDHMTLCESFHWSQVFGACGKYQCIGSTGVYGGTVKSVTLLTQINSIKELNGHNIEY